MMSVSPGVSRESVGGGGNGLTTPDDSPTIPGSGASMKRHGGIIRIRKRHGRLLRAVALFFLLYTGADIALPQYFCAGEAGGLPDVVITSTVTADNTYTFAGGGAVSGTKDSQREQPNQEAPHDEDCFCCCAHVLAVPGMKVVETVELKSFPTSPDERSVLSPPLPLQYRPPRFA